MLQLQQLKLDKQRLQQDAKKHDKVVAKLQDKLQSAELELATLQAQHATAAVQLLSLKSDLDIAQQQLFLMQQQGGQGSGLVTDHGVTSGYSSSTSDEDQEISSAYCNVEKHLRIAFVGGRNLKRSHMKMLPPGAEVRHFGSARDVGEGEIKSLEACIKAGSVDEVYMMTRWNSHTTTQYISRLCKRLDIPVHLLGSSQIVAAKNKAAGASSAASTEVGSN
eukprot:gene6194-6430_t